MMRPALPNEPSSSAPRSDALVSCETSTSSSRALSVCSGRSSIFASFPAPLRPSSSSDSARIRLMRVNAVSAHASRMEKRNSAMTAATIAQSAPLISSAPEPAARAAQATLRSGTGSDRDCPPRRSLSVRSPRVGHGTWRSTGAQRSVPLVLELAEAGQQLALPTLHRRMLARIGMVIVQQMQDSVDDEQRELLFGGPPVLRRLCGGDPRAHHHVADQARGLPRLGRRTRAAAALVGLPAAEHHVVVHRERQDVSRAGATEKP